MNPSEHNDKCFASAESAKKEAKSDGREAAVETPFYQNDEWAALHNQEIWGAGPDGTYAWRNGPDGHFADRREEGAEDEFPRGRGGRQALVR